MRGARHARPRHRLLDCRAAGQIDRLGSGSDHTALLDDVDVPSLQVGFSKGGGEYHTSWGLAG